MSRITAMFSLFLLTAIMFLCGPRTADAGPFNRFGGKIITPAARPVVGSQATCANGQCGIPVQATSAPVVTYSTVPFNTTPVLNSTYNATPFSAYSTPLNSVTVGGSPVWVGVATAQPSVRITPTFGMVQSSFGSSCSTCQRR
jgi:hypothetical protein